MHKVLLEAMPLRASWLFFRKKGSLKKNCWLCRGPIHNSAFSWKRQSKKDCFLLLSEPLLLSNNSGGALVSIVNFVFTLSKRRSRIRSKVWEKESAIETSRLSVQKINICRTENFVENLRGKPQISHLSRGRGSLTTREAQCMVYDHFLRKKRARLINYLPGSDGLWENSTRRSVKRHREENLGVIYVALRKGWWIWASWALNISCFSSLGCD